MERDWTTAEGTSSTEAAQRNARRMRSTRALTDVRARPEPIIESRTARRASGPKLSGRGLAVEQPERAEGRLDVDQLPRERPIRGPIMHLGVSPERQDHLGDRRDSGRLLDGAAGLGATKAVSHSAMVRRYFSWLASVPCFPR